MTMTIERALGIVILVLAIAILVFLLVKVA